MEASTTSIVAAFALYTALGCAFTVLCWRHYELHRTRPSGGLLLFTTLLLTEAAEMILLAVTLGYRVWYVSEFGDRPAIESFLILARIPTIFRAIIAYAFLWALRYSTYGPERVTTPREVVRYLAGGVGHWVDGLLAALPGHESRLMRKRRKAQHGPPRDPHAEE